MFEIRFDCAGSRPLVGDGMEIAHVDGYCRRFGRSQCRSTGCPCSRRI
jgi:hypothetical protein